MTSQSESHEWAPGTGAPQSTWRPRPDFSRFVALDLETTSLDPREGEIVEIGCARFAEGRETEVFHAFVKPVRGFPERNRRLTGINPEDLTGGKQVGAALQELKDFIGNDLLVVHNAAFDIGFLGHYFKASGWEVLDNPAVCTQRLAALVMPEAHSFYLGALADFWGIARAESHRALGDARLAGRLAVRLIEEMRSWPALFLAHLASYRGKSLDPMFDLLEWLAGDADAAGWRLDRAVQEKLLTGASDALPPFPQIADFSLSAGLSQPDSILEVEIAAAMSRTGLTVLEDMRPGAGSPISSSVVSKVPSGRLVLAVASEEEAGKVPGAAASTDGGGGERGMAYLGCPEEYVCLSKALGEDGRPSGWLLLSPFERTVLVRWLAGTWTGRHGSLGWWLRNNFPGLRGHFASVSATASSCITCREGRCREACYLRRAEARASSAGTLVVRHGRLFQPVPWRSGLPATGSPAVSVLIEKAQNLTRSAREALTLELDPGTLAREFLFHRDRTEGSNPVVGELLAEAEQIFLRIQGAARAAIGAYRESSDEGLHASVVLHRDIWETDAFLGLASTLELSRESLLDIAGKLKSCRDGAGWPGELGDLLCWVCSVLGQFLRPDPGFAALVEGTPPGNPRRVSFRLIPLDVSAAIRGFLDCVTGSAVMVGRNLSRSGSFDTIARDWGISGLENVVFKRLDNPAPVFPDMCVPEGISVPVSKAGGVSEWERYIERVSNLIRLIAGVLRGRTVAVFNSHHDLCRAREILGKVPPAGCTVLAQYVDGTKGPLVREYIANPATLVLGGRTFLDDVDLSPAGFTALVIVKAPFPSPAEPLHRAAIALAESRGLDPVREHVVPEMLRVMNTWIDSLVAGRAVHPDSPSGAVVLLDPRPVTSDWSEDFISALNVSSVAVLPLKVILEKLEKYGCCP